MLAKTDQPTGSYRGLVSACTVLATLMQALDTTIANVALPYMQGSFAAAPDQITWVLTSYIVAAAIMTAPVGWLSARFGRKTLFIACLAGFTFASVLCGLANSLEQMVMFRLLQGAFGAAANEPCMYGRATLAMVVSSACISVASTVQALTMPR